MVFRLFACFVVLCALLFAACYLGTGSDARNMRSVGSYPAAVRERALADPRLMALAPACELSATATFAANLVAFTLVLAVVSVLARPGGFTWTLLGLLAVGEGLNLFDLAVIDALWWRRSPRVRLSGIDDPALYRDMGPHLASFARGTPMFALAALLASLIACALPL